MVYVLIFCWVVDLERQTGDPGCKMAGDLYVQKAQIANFQFHFGLPTSMKRQKVGGVSTAGCTISGDLSGRRVEVQDGTTEAQFGAAAALCTPSCRERTATAGQNMKRVDPLREGWGGGTSRE